MMLCEGFVVCWCGLFGCVFATFSRHSLGGVCANIKRARAKYSIEQYIGLFNSCRGGFVPSVVPSKVPCMLLLGTIGPINHLLVFLCFFMCILQG